MKSRFNKLFALLAFSLLMCLILPCIVWVHSQQRQYSINRQLINALERSDIEQAIALVEAGADPNTRYKPLPAPTLVQLMNQLLHRSPSLLSKGPTAFMMACASGWGEGQGPYKRVKLSESDAEQTHLRQTMFLHGANLNAKDEGSWTALHWAVSAQNKSIIKHLLAYGANPYVHNPNSDEGDGESPLKMAEDTGRPDIIALFHKISKRP